VIIGLYLVAVGLEALSALCPAYHCPSTSTSLDEIHAGTVLNLIGAGMIIASLVM
jgi:hypothetical protein